MFSMTSGVRSADLYLEGEGAVPGKAGKAAASRVSEVEREHHDFILRHENRAGGGGAAKLLRGLRRLIAEVCDREIGIRTGFVDRSLATGDLNADGKADLVVITPYYIFPDSPVNVYIGNGDGTFRALASLDSPAWLSADFNNDGNSDLVLVPAPGQLALAFGRGASTFAKGITVSTPFPAASWVAGDFNGDGRIDLAISPIATSAGAPTETTAVSNLAVLRGNGDGTFQTPLITGNAAGPILATADMNGDGKPDLIIGSSVLAGLGDGTFRFPVFLGVATPSCFPGCQVNSGSAAVVSDLNGDGAPDVIEAYSVWAPRGAFRAPGLSVLLNGSPGDGFLVTGVSSASYKWPIGAVSLVTAFGNNLAAATEAAPDTTAPPTTLGGIRIHLRDRTIRPDSKPTPERLATLFYVSPNQINFEVSTTDTSVYAGIERVGFPYTAKGMVIPVQPIAADLFTLNSAGLAAASAVRVSTEGNLDPVPVVSCSGALCTAAPMDVSRNPVYLSLYGTGFDSSSPSTDTVCTVGGLKLQKPGLDQINLLLPSSLAGRGDVAIQCSVGSGVTAVATGVLHVTVQ